MVTATEVIDLDPEFDKPTTIVVDDMTERASVGEALTSGVVAPMVGGGFLPMGLSPENVLTDSDLLRIRFQYGISYSVELRLPKPDERADSADDDWVCFYELPFKQGLRFPISYLMLAPFLTGNGASFLRTLSSLGQL
ncbi:hypothetical protein ACOSQ3_013191 [Xanthoceras sorbifolium]